MQRAGSPYLVLLTAFKWIQACTFFPFLKFSQSCKLYKFWWILAYRQKQSNGNLPGYFSKAVSWWRWDKFSIDIYRSLYSFTLGPVTKGSIIQSSGKMVQPSAEQDVYTDVCFGQWLPYILTIVPNHSRALKAFRAWRSLDYTIKIPLIPSFKIVALFNVSWWLHLCHSNESNTRGEYVSSIHLNLPLHLMLCGAHWRSSV